MTPRSLFNIINIIIKIFGLFFIKEIIDAIPRLVASFLYFSNIEMAQEGFLTVIVTVILLAFYAFIANLLLFKTNAIIHKLKLAQGFDQEEFSFNFPTSSVWPLVLFVMGGLVLVNEIPNFGKLMVTYFEEKQINFNIEKPVYSPVILSAIKIIIGLLLIGERKRIGNFIERRTIKNLTNEEE